MMPMAASEKEAITITGCPPNTWLKANPAAAANAAKAACHFLSPVLSECQPVKSIAGIAHRLGIAETRLTWNVDKPGNFCTIFGSQITRRSEERRVGKECRS